MTWKNIGETETQIEVDGTVEHINTDQSEDTKYAITTEGLVEFSGKTEDKVTLGPDADLNVSIGRANWRHIEWEYDLVYSSSDSTLSHDYEMWFTVYNDNVWDTIDTTTDESVQVSITGGQKSVHPEDDKQFYEDMNAGGGTLDMSASAYMYGGQFTDDHFMRVAGYTNRDVIVNITDITESLL